MRRLILLTFVALFCSPGATFPQTVNSDASEVMRQLLSFPAPPPRIAKTADDNVKKERSPEFFDEDKPPADDAPLEDVMDFWLRWADRIRQVQPSDTIKRRLLETCSDDVQKLPLYVELFSDDEATAKKIKALFDKALRDQLLDETSQEKIKKWLVFNSKYFLDELFAQASQARDAGGFIHNNNALIALARLDSQTAEPLLQSLAAGSQPRTSALAITLLYRQAIDAKDLDLEEKYRARLKTIASDRSAFAYARETAISVLSFTEWSGRDDWYTSLLADDSLIEPLDSNTIFNPLTTLFDRDPAKWIPVMAKLVESKDRAVQQNAATCLVIHGTSHPSREAILPVLRWLSDPDWLELSGTRRGWFVQTMNELDIPESVPGLIWIVENDTESAHWAARALGNYKDPRVVPVLKKALQESRDYNREAILDGLLASNGISDSEATTALETYAAKLMSPEGRQELEQYRPYQDDPPPIPLSVGKYLASSKTVPDSLARAVLAHATTLKKTNPMMAQSLFQIANRWESPQIDLDMIRRIAGGKADANTIASALNRRTKLSENFGTELQVMVQRSGEPLGVGSVLLNDANLEQGILTSEDERAQIALLASARLTQTSLPVDLVAKLLPSKNSLLALAAERYLLAVDSKEARKALWRHHPDQAFVTGWRENAPDVGLDNIEQLAKTEEKLRVELLKPDGPREIFALFDDNGVYSNVLRIFEDKAIYTQQTDSARYIERVVSKTEVSVFKQFITTAGLQDLGPQFGYCHENCWTAEFLALRKDEPWRIVSRGGISDSQAVINNFDLLGQAAGSKIHYHFEKEIPGLEVVYADTQLLVKDVWQHGNEIRVFVERKETEDEISQKFSRPFPEEEAARAELRRQDFLRDKARFSWRKLSSNKAGTVVPQPDSYATVDETKFSIIGDDSWSTDDQQVQSVSPDTIIAALNSKGLWKQVAGSKAERISDDGPAYANPVVTPDGKWVVVSKADSDWSGPNYIVRFNLQTGQEFRVKLTPAEQLDPIRFLSQHNKVLVRRARDDDEYVPRARDSKSAQQAGPEKPEFYLLDPATGNTQLVSGEFTPLLSRGQRFLQTTTKPGEFWATIPDETKDQTQVGRYNLKDFSFKPVMVIPHIIFESQSMWVDESRGKLYIVYKDQLLSVPLKTD